MSDTPIVPPESPETPPKKHSLLDDILHASSKKQEEKTPQLSTESSPSPSGNSNPGSPEKPKIKKEPISMAVFLKLIGSLLVISIIFFGSFLAYIAFNPSQAIFFINTFNIDPGDVQNLLKKLINGSF